MYLVFDGGGISSICCRAVSTSRGLAVAILPSAFARLHPVAIHGRQSTKASGKARLPIRQQQRVREESGIPHKHINTSPLRGNRRDSSPKDRRPIAVMSGTRSAKIHHLEALIAAIMAKIIAIPTNTGTPTNIR
jgi:hypothetical protein